MPTKSLIKDFPFEAKERVWPELRRFVSAVEARLLGIEGETSTFEEEVAKFEALGLAAVNDAIAPLVTQAIERLTSVARLFEASSPTEVTIGLGAQEFLIPGDERLTFVATPYLSIYNGDGSAGMLAELDSFNPITGELRVVATVVDGAGTYDEWTIRVAAPPTAGAVSAPYVEAELNALYAQLSAQLSALSASTLSTIRGGVASNLDTLQKLAGAVAGNPNFATDLNTVLAGYALKNNPALTGVPTAPTAASGNNSTQLATTAFVQAALTTFLTRAPYSHGVKSSGSITPQPSLGPVQVVDKAGSFTINAPSENGFVALFIRNTSGTGTITFSGFEKVLSGGDAYEATNAARFLMQIQSVVVGADWNLQSYMLKKLTA
jgi:hypothetical protein